MPPLAPTLPAPKRLAPWSRLFAPAPPAAVPVTDLEAIRKGYRFWQRRVLLSGWGLGTLVQHHGWDAGFACLLVVAGIGTILFIAAWPAKADGY